jgi:thioredoxin 1
VRASIDVKMVNILGAFVLAGILVGMFAFSQRKLLDGRELPEGSFKQTVLESDVPVLVDFGADWCGACRAMSPILDEFERSNPSVKVVRVNVDKNRDLARQLKIRAIPTLMVFKNGNMTAQQTGVVDHDSLRRMVER